MAPYRDFRDQTPTLYGAISLCIDLAVGAAVVWATDSAVAGALSAIGCEVLITTLVYFFYERRQPKTE